mgnify:CR=1 FL=1
MAAKNTDLTIRWPFAPNHVRTNSDTGLLKLIAMIAMLCDHAGKMLFPQYRVLRIIGRIAFPIYAYCIAVGCVYTRNPFAYLKRIALLALISQPIYAVSMAHSVKSMYAVSFAEKPVQKLAVAGVDSVLELAQERSDFVMSDEEFAAFVKYHLNFCEKRELLGGSSHLLYICRKK